MSHWQIHGFRFWVSDVYFCQKELDQDLTAEEGGGKGPRYRGSLGLAAEKKLSVTRIFNVWFSCSRSSSLLPSQKHRAGRKIMHNLAKFAENGKGGLEPTQISGRVSAESQICVSCRLFQVMMGRRWFHVSQTFSDLGPKPRPSWGTQYELAPAQPFPYPILLETQRQEPRDSNTERGSDCGSLNLFRVRHLDLDLQRPGRKRRKEREGNHALPHCVNIPVTKGFARDGKIELIGIQVISLPLIMLIIENICSA